MTGFHPVHIAWPVTAFHLSWQKLWRTRATTSGPPLAGLVNDRPALSLMRQRAMKEEVEKLTKARAVLDYVVDWPE